MGNKEKKIIRHVYNKLDVDLDSYQKKENKEKDTSENNNRLFVYKIKEDFTRNIDNKNHNNRLCMVTSIKEMNNKEDKETLKYR